MKDGQKYHEYLEDLLRRTLVIFPVKGTWDDVDRLKEEVEEVING